MLIFYIINQDLKCLITITLYSSKWNWRKFMIFLLNFVHPKLYESHHRTLLAYWFVLSSVSNIFLQICLTDISGLNMPADNIWELGVLINHTRRTPLLSSAWIGLKIVVIFRSLGSSLLSFIWPYLWLWNVCIGIKTEQTIFFIKVNANSEKHAIWNIFEFSPTFLPHLALRRYDKVSAIVIIWVPQ